MRNRRRECEIASKCTKTAGQVLADIAEQTVTPVLVTCFEGAKLDAYAKLTLYSLQFADSVGWRTTTSFIFPSDVLRL